MVFWGGDGNGDGGGGICYCWVVVMVFGNSSVGGIYCVPMVNAVSHEFGFAGIVPVPSG